jgi:pantetheine-phosphate adenylyltransferase
MSRVAVFPGSFDPMTMAHLDVARRAAALFDRLVIGVLNNPKKAPLFAVEQRVAMIQTAVAEFAANVQVESFDGLTVEFAEGHGAGFIVRGLRAVSDFEAELQMAHTNRRLEKRVDTVFLMTALEFGYLSSTLAKEVAQFGGDVAGMVPPAVADALAARFAATDARRPGEASG